MLLYTFEELGITICQTKPSQLLAIAILQYLNKIFKVCVF